MIVNDVNGFTSGSGNETVTFESLFVKPHYISIINDSMSDMTITLSNESIILKPSEVFEATFSTPFDSVDIVTSGDWRLLVGA